MSVRVIRLMEYTYASGEDAIADMERWEVPANGTRGYGAQTIRSAVIPTYLLDDESEFW